MWPAFGGLSKGFSIRGFLRVLRTSGVEVFVSFFVS